MVTTDNEVDLIRELRNGSQPAAAAFVDRHYEAIYAFLRRLSGSDADAADLTQRTFTRTWAALANFGGRSTLSGWLHGIARHVYLDWLRANHRTTSMPDDWWLACPDPTASPDARVAESDLARTVYREVDRLEAGLRETVHLHYYQGLTLDETATALEVATSTVKYRLRVAVQELQTRLADRPLAALATTLNRRP